MVWSRGAAHSSRMQFPILQMSPIPIGSAAGLPILWSYGMARCSALTLPATRGKLISLMTRVVITDWHLLDQMQACHASHPHVWSVQSAKTAVSSQDIQRDAQFSKHGGVLF